MNNFEKDGVLFSDKELPGIIQNFGPISVKVSGQNRLPEIKKRMVKIAKSKGANAIMNYSCDQKSHKWWEQLFTFKWDSESWHGSGIAVEIHSDKIKS